MTEFDVEAWQGLLRSGFKKAADEMRREHNKNVFKEIIESPDVDLGPDLSQPENYSTPTRIHFKADGTKYLTDRRVKLSAFYHGERRS